MLTYIETLNDIFSTMNNQTSLIPLEFSTDLNSVRRKHLHYAPIFSRAIFSCAHCIDWSITQLNLSSFLMTWWWFVIPLYLKNSSFNRYSAIVGIIVIRTWTALWRHTSKISKCHAVRSFSDIWIGYMLVGHTLHISAQELLETPVVLTLSAAMSLLPKGRLNQWKIPLNLK